jgi:hypothetical protein
LVSGVPLGLAEDIDMVTRTLAATGLAVLLAAAPAAAQAPLSEAAFRSGTAGGLAELCGAAPNDPLYGPAIGWCHGFILATGQYHQAIAGRRTAGHPLFCLPDPSPDFDTMRAGFVAYVRANPQVQAERAIDGFIRFLIATHPCQPRRR